MIWTVFRGALVACALGLCVPAQARGDDAAPTAAELTAGPAIEDPMLSPDGSRVVARALVGGRARLALYDALHPGNAPFPIALPDAERLEWYRWIDGRRLLVSLLTQGDAPTSRLVAVDLASGSLVQIGRPRDAGLGDEVLHVDRGGAFLLLKRQPDPDREPSVERIDLSSGARSLAVAARPHVWDWVADSAGVIRAGVANRGGRSWLLYRGSERDGFSRSGRGAGDSQPSIERFVPVRGTDQGYAMAEARSGRLALFRYDFRRSRLGALVYENPQVDIDGFEAGPAGDLLGVAYSADRDTMHWFAPAMARRQAVLDAALPGRANRVVSASADEGRLLVFSQSAGDPGAYYLFDGTAAQLLAEVNPALRGKPAGTMRPIRYRARDGLEITGFLTLPAGHAAKGLPLVVMPHGGPFARDSWGFDPWVQYLAGKGYAVLQPNYRGSTGFGRAFLAKGDGEWGRGMQDDADDGVAWLAARGIADPARVCIMGASYGGYAAMWAAARDSRLYRCAISYAGISDIDAQLAYDHQTFEEGDYRAWRQRIQGKAPSLAALSPLAFARTLRMPLLLAHGTADDTVLVAQSQMLHDALLRLGTAHEFVLYPGAHHSLSDPADSVDFLERVGRFLDAHNPA